MSIFIKLLAMLKVKFPSLRLRGRYVSVHMIIVLLTVMILSCVQFYFFNKNAQIILQQTTLSTSASMLEQMKKRNIEVLEYLSESLINPVYQHDLDATYQLLVPILNNSEIKAIYVFDDQGRLFHDGLYESINLGLPIKNIAVVNAVIDNREDYVSLNKDRLTIAKPILLGNMLLGGIYVELSLQQINNDIKQMSDIFLEENEQSLRNVSLILLLAACVLSFIGLVLSIFISNSLVRPIQALALHAKQIGKGKFDLVNSIQRKDEIGELAETFNNMGKKLKARTEEITFLAYHDSLTSLANRPMFVKHIAKLISNSTASNLNFFVLFIDLDDFKMVNDNFGHKAGDHLLCEIAERIKRHLILNESITQDLDDLLIARIGGDEFLICLPESIIKSDINRFTQTLVQTIRTPITINTEEVIVAASVGLAKYPNDGKNAEELIKNADIAMFEAKKVGKNTYSFFTVEMDQLIKNRAMLERDLRKALLDLPQLELWYQPQFDLANDTLIGAEALLRWNHPELGIIYPDQFISIAEETGLIIPIGNWIIESACKQLKQWKPQLDEKPFHLALNMSARQIYQNNPTDIFKKMLKKYQVEADSLHIEVTETLLMRDENEAKNMLNAIRALGVEVWLDDFGTGYSSLAYLRHFEVDGLKIDRSFIMDIDQGNYDKALTSAIIAIAHSLNIKVVAEGVEKQTHVDFLKQQQCHFGQGYFYAKALPPSVFTTQFLAK